MSTANRSARKAAAITDTANKARTAAGKVTRPGIRPDRPVAGTGAKRIARPSLGRSIRGRGPVYEVPRPVRPKPVKK